MEKGNEDLLTVQAIRSAIDNKDDINFISVNADVDVMYKTISSSIRCSNFNKFTFNNCNIDGLIIYSTFKDCAFLNCNFNCNIKDCEFAGCRFVNCTFSGKYYYNDDTENNVSEQLFGFASCKFDNKTDIVSCTFIDYRLLDYTGKTSAIFNCKDVRDVSFINCTLPMYDELYVRGNYREDRAGEALFHYYFFYSPKVVITPQYIIKLDKYLSPGKEYTINTLPKKLIDSLNCNCYFSISKEFRKQLCSLIHKMNLFQAEDVLNTINGEAK